MPWGERGCIWASGPGWKLEGSVHVSVGIQWAHTVSMWPLGPAEPRGRLYPLKQSFGLRLLLMHLVLSPLGLDGTLHAQEAGAFHPAIL